MKNVTPLFGYLGKSGGGSSTPEEGDTRVSIPGVLMPTIRIPFPHFSFMIAPVAGGTPPIVNSFMYAEETLFNAAASPVLFTVGEGLWDFKVYLNIRESGAVSDATSSYRLAFFDQLVGSTVVLARITNKQGVDQAYEVSWTQLITSDNLYTFNSVSVAGLGTGLNFAHLRIIGTRYF